MKSTINCTMHRNGEVNQHQCYTIEQGNKSLSIQEHATIEGNKSIAIDCLFSITPAGYSDISLSVARDGNISHKLDFTHHSSESSKMVVNGVGSDVELNGEMILLDGPNPMFDYANAMYLLGIQDMEICIRTVNVLDWNTGVFYPLEYEFSKKENTISINKKEMGITGELTLDASGSAITEASYSNGEQYFFEYS